MCCRWYTTAVICYRQALADCRKNPKTPGDVIIELEEEANGWEEFSRDSFCHWKKSTVVLVSHSIACCRKKVGMLHNRVSEKFRLSALFPTNSYQSSQKEMFTCSSLGGLGYILVPLKQIQHPCLYNSPNVT